MEKLLFNALGNKLKLISFSVILLSFVLTSCLTTKTNVGGYKEKTGTEYT
jgi:hypothetical protein